MNDQSLSGANGTKVVRVADPYKMFADSIERELTAIWTDEPWEIAKIRWGLIQGRAGSYGQRLATIVTLESVLLNFGPDILFRLSYFAQNESWNPVLPEAIRYITHTHFDLAGTLRSAGLERLADAYDEYLALLTRNDLDRGKFLLINQAITQYVFRHHRWVHMIFPWNLGAAYNKASDREIAKMYGILVDRPTPPLELCAQVPVSIKPLANSAHIKADDPKWMRFLDKVQNHIDEQWLNEPWEITKIKWGLIDTGAGSGGQFFSVLVHLEIFLEAAKCVIYAMAMFVKSNPAQFDFAKLLLRYILKESFDAFEFLKDLGLAYLQELGEQYFEAVADPETGRNELFEISTAFVLDMSRMLSWVKSIQPWNPAARFAQHDDLELRQIFELIQTHPTPEIG